MVHGMSEEQINKERGQEGLQGGPVLMEPAGAL